MKSLYKFLEDVMATPMNTVGMGNPGMDAAGTTLTEPIGTDVDKKKRPKRPLNKKKVKL